MNTLEKSVDSVQVEPYRGQVMRRMTERQSDNNPTGADPVEEAGETTAADSTPTPTDTRPVGEGTVVDVEGEGESR